MDALSSIVLAALALAVWAYVTYVAVSAGVRKGMRDALKEKSEDV